MDRTEQYIKMCDCEEIQGGWIPRWGDFVSEEYGPVVQTFTTQPGKIGLVWLPRQDQLQGMIPELIDKIHRLYHFDKFIFDHKYLPITHQCPYVYFVNLFDRYDIEEILWLAFVMHKLHGKKWNGSEWVSA